MDEAVVSRKLSFLFLPIFLISSLSHAVDKVVLREGETLWTIAEKHGLRIEDLLEVNGLTEKEARKLRAGDVVFVPSEKEEIYDVVPPYPARFVGGDGVRLRTAPSLDSKVITHLSRNTKIYMLAFTDTFVKVQVHRGPRGWIARKYVRVSRSNGESSWVSSLRRSVVLSARSKLGARYRWGASGNGAYDCSGFVMAVFSKFKMKLPHSAAAQFKEGKPVKKKDLKPGDLVFFSTYRPGPSHVGIYIGHGKFIHASSSSRHRGVTISSLAEGYYRRRYIGARRLVE